MHEPSTPRLITRRGFLLAPVAVSLIPVRDLLHADEPKAEKDGFLSLFNGRDLDGWHTNRARSAHGSGGLWQVEDGVLTGQQDPPGSGNGGLLLSDRRYADFELLIDMHPDWGPDSGVFFRCTEEGAGFQMYVDYHDGGNVGHLRGEMPGAFALKPFQLFGKLNDAKELTGFSTRPDPRAQKWPRGVYEHTCTAEAWLRAWRVNQWNTARIRCVGKYPKVTTWINDLKVCHFNGETSAHPGYDKDRVLKILGRSGSIGFQVHGGKAWPNGAKCRWRNIRIKEL
jgi:hypothetical protein